MHLTHISAYSYLIGRPAQNSVLVSELVPPSNRSVADLGHRQGALYGVPIGYRMKELGVAVDKWEGNLMFGQDGVVVHATRELPRFLIESVCQVPESRVIDYLGQIDHREVYPSV